MKHIFYKLLILSTLLAFNHSVYANGFDLFDKNRDAPPPAPPKPKPEIKPVNPFTQLPKTPPPKPPIQMFPQKDFVLKGVSQIGNRYIVFLEAPNSKMIQVDMGSKRRVSINNGFPDYHLIRMTDREVKIDYPDNAPCRRSNPQKGIKCVNGGKSATLDFTVGKPLASNTVVSSNPPNQVNPFLAAMNKNKQLSEEEKAKREEALQKRRELYKNFKRQVIKDEDVPEGMRVVRTPFGDRLVPDNK
jgi:hypothetical protein